MPLVDDVAVRYNLEHDIFVMPGETRINIGFPCIPAFDLFDMLDFLNDQEIDWCILSWGVPNLAAWVA